MRQAEQIDKNNKNVELGLALCTVIYSVMQDIDQINTEIEFRHQINARAESHLKTIPKFAQSMSMSANAASFAAAAEPTRQRVDPGMCYKLLRYIMSTQRKALINLVPRLMPQAAQTNAAAQPAPNT